jgi:hypothetical protein
LVPTKQSHLLTLEEIASLRLYAQTAGNDMEVDACNDNAVLKIEKR